MKHVHRRILSAAAVLVIASSNGLNAQPQQPQQPSQPNALQGFSQNRDQPVNIKSDALDVRDRSKVATFSGNVHLVQGDTTLRSKTLVVYYDGENAGGPTVSSPAAAPTGSQQIRKMEAKGDVLVTQKDQTATGDSAIYDLKSNTVTLFAPSGGFVVLTQGPNIIKGARLVVNLATSVSHVEGGTGGVISIFVPSKADKPGDTKGGDKNDSRAGPNARPAPAPAPKARSNSPTSGLY
jgi:lipopolysaccharide export system protein LptA